MIDTKVKTKSVTNTQLAVATLAMFMAGGLAFAAAPAQNRAAAPKCGVNSSKVVNVIKGCARGQYSGIDFSCYDGTRVQHRPGVCMTAAQLNAVAAAGCANRCNRPAVPPQVATGTLALAMDTDYIQNTDFLRYPRYVLNGSRDIVARVRVTAGPQEPVTLRSLSLSLVDANIENLRQHVSSFSIFTENMMGNAIGQMTVDEMLANDLNYQIPAGATQYLYIQANTIPVNENTASGTPMDNIGFSLRLNDFQPTARGNTSGNNITPEIDTNSRSARIDIMPVIISNLDFPDFQGGQLVAGNQTLFAFDPVAMGGENRTINGNIMKVALESLKIRVDTNLLPQDFSNLELCRVESNECMALMFSSTTPNYLTSVSEFPDNLREDTFIYVYDARDFRATQSHLIDSNEEAHFIVRGTVLRAPEGSFVQMRLSNVENRGLTYSFEWQEDGYPDGWARSLRINREFHPNYPDILGATLAN